MTLADIQAKIDSERARLEALEAQLTSSDFWKQKCVRLIGDLDLLETFCKPKAGVPPLSVGQLNFSLEMAVDGRKKVEEAIRQYGPDLISAPHDLENQRPK